MGEVELTPDVLDAAARHMTIQASSLAVVDAISRKDRQETERQRREDLLQTVQDPEIVFKSTYASAEKLTDHQYRVKSPGSLSLHGVYDGCAANFVTRTEQITAHMTVDGGTLRAHGKFTLRQTTSIPNLPQIGKPTGGFPVRGLLIQADMIVQRIPPDRLVVAVGGREPPGQD